MNNIDKYKNLKIKYDALKRESAHNKKLFKKSISELSREIDENVATKLDLINKNDLLIERIKELKCLNEISITGCDDDLNLDIFIIKVVSIIASAFRYPEYTSVEIKYKDRLYQSENFIKTSLSLNQVLNSKKNIIGRISIYYNDEIAKINNSTFLNEAKQFLTTIAYNLGEIINRSETNKELKKEKEKANESKRNFSEILDNTKVHLWAFDGTKYTYMNKAWYDFTGQALNTPLTIELWTSVQHPDDIEESGKIWMKNFEAKTEHDNYYRLRRYDGIYRYFSSHVIPVFDTKNNFKYFQGVNVDITDLKKAEIELVLSKQKAEENEKRFQSLSEAAFESIFLTEKGVCIDQNSSAEKMFGYTLKEAIGRMGIEWIVPEDREKVMNNMRLSYAETYEVTALRKDGSRFAAEVQAKNSLYKGRMIRVTALTDISARKKAVKALKESEVKYRTLVDDVNEGFYVSDLHGVITFANRALAHIFGFENPDEIIGKKFTKFLPSEKVNELFKQYQIALTSGTATEIIFTEIIRQNGTPRFIEIKPQIILEDGKTIGVRGLISDITERKQVEEELKIAKEKAEESESILKAAMENSQAGIVIADFPSGKITYINKATFSIIDKYPDEIIKTIDVEKYVKSWQILHLDRSPYKTEEVPLARAILYGESISEEFIVRNKNNEDKIVWANAAPILNETGNQIGAIVVFLDITQRKEAEFSLNKTNNELSLAKKNYEHIAKNVPEAIFIIGRDSSILYANRMASEVIAYSNSEILKLKLTDFIHPDDCDKIRLRLIARLKGHILEPQYETRIKTKKGETKAVVVSGLKTKWRGKDVDLTVITDVTEKRRFENLLNIQNNIDYLSSISVGLKKSLTNIFDMLIEFSWIDGGGVYQMTDAQNVLQLRFHKGLSRKFIKRYQNVPQGSEQYSAMILEKPLYLKSTESFPESKYLKEEGIKQILIVPLLHNNRIIGALNLISMHSEYLNENEKMIFESIGNRIAQMIVLINAQEELKAKNKELQQTIKDVQEKQQLLIQKSKLESLGEMAAGVAHEINQPLGIIFLSLENILFNISQKNLTQEYLDKKLNSITDNINKIKKIIDHIRTFSRDQKSIIIERFDINKVIRKACSMVSEQYTHHNLLINLDLKEDIGYTLGNNHKLEQVLYNLLSNAKYALEDKELFTSVGTFEKEIQIRTYCDENKIYIEVKDNGTGIEKENLDNIFNPFFTTKPVGKGTGLGLSIVYGIITEMKGSISIVSVINEYTIVSIELPRTQ